MPINNAVAKDILSKLIVEVIHAEYYTCKSTWGYTDQLNNFNKLYFIMDGEGFGKIDSTEFYVQPGQFILIPSNSVHSFSTSSSNSIKKYFCHFISKTGDLELFEFFKIPYYIDKVDNIILKELFEKLVTNLASNNYMSILRVKSVMLEIIIYYFDNIQSEKIEMVSSKSTEIISRVVKYISNNLSKNISINDLAELVYLHPNYFIKFFKKHMGSSPKNYINKLRLEKAKKLLITTEMNITDISREIGYSDTCYFSKYFKKNTGFTPTEFKNIREK